MGCKDSQAAVSFSADSREVKFVAMPTVLRQDGFDVRIFVRDHEPKHVHVRRGGGVAVIILGDVSVRERFGMSPRDVRTALQIVAENRDYLVAQWDRIKPVP